MLSFFGVSPNTKRVCLCLLAPICMVTGAKKLQPVEDFTLWRKAVVNIETESFIYPKYYVDSVCRCKKDSGYDKHALDSISAALSCSTMIRTGTAIYIRYRGRRYLITARHVLMDEALVEQKTFENKNGINNWDDLEAIYPRISIRTPFEYFSVFQKVNNFAVVTNSFVKGPKPYFFISDSVGDGIGFISLQAKDYKFLDTILQINGYSPAPLEQIINNKSINVSDEVYAIGFPEMVSIVARATFAQPVPLDQSADLVIPFMVKGTVAMYEKNIQHYYVDLTINPGNSGSPILRKGKLIGIVSGINTYRIIDKDSKPAGQPLFGIGHLVNIINTEGLKKGLDSFRKEEDSYLASQQ